ncbi:MAG: hypothetical protein WBC51_09565 [Vicinamibacterales bacterium]
MRARRLLGVLACVVPMFVFLAVYVPAAGHGFISDDFAWILHNRVRAPSDIWRIATSDNGFYRPAVAFSFAFNELAFDLKPRAYGLINVAFAVLCAGAIFVLGRALNLSRGAAGFGAILWLLNLHGVNMAILWISGRTALLATAAAAACTAAVLRRRNPIGALLLIVAVTSREDAAMLAVVTTAWLCVLWRDQPDRKTAVWRWLFISIAIVGVYLAVRSTTNAMTPTDAPAYYRFTWSLSSVGRNALEYADRTMTTTAAALVLLIIVMRPRLQLFDRELLSVAACGGLWLVAFLLPALLLPVRSSLYACLPSVGPCVVAAALAQRWWTVAGQTRRQYALVAAIVVPLLLWPVYQGRTARWVGMAEFSTRAVAELTAATANLPDDSDILIVDDRTQRANIASVFSTMLRDAFLVTSGRYMTFYVEPPVPNAEFRSGGRSGCGGCEDVRLIVRDGGLVRTDR